MGVLTEIKKKLIYDLMLNGHHLDEQDGEFIRKALDQACAVGATMTTGMTASERKLMGDLAQALHALTHGDGPFTTGDWHGFTCCRMMSCDRARSALGFPVPGLPGDTRNDEGVKINTGGQPAPSDRS